MNHVLTIKANIAALIGAVVEIGEAGMQGAEAGCQFRDEISAFAGLASALSSVSLLNENLGEYRAALDRIAYLIEQPSAVVQQRFNDYVASRPFGWREGYALFMAGDTEIWGALRG